MLQSVRELLKGWKIEVFSDFPQTPDVKTTCSMFHRASLIMGPHGAGLANLICSRKGVPLIEFQQKYHSWDYQLLSMKLGMPYIGIKTDMDHGGPGKVDIKAVRSAVKQALAMVPAAANLAAMAASPASVQPAPAPVAIAPTTLVPATRAPAVWTPATSILVSATPAFALATRSPASTTPAPTHSTSGPAPLTQAPAPATWTPATWDEPAAVPVPGRAPPAPAPPRIPSSAMSASTPITWTPATWENAEEVPPRPAARSPPPARPLQPASQVFPAPHRSVEGQATTGVQKTWASVATTSSPFPALGLATVGLSPLWFGVGFAAASGCCALGILIFLIRRDQDVAPSMRAANGFRGRGAPPEVVGSYFDPDEDPSPEEGDCLLHK